MQKLIAAMFLFFYCLTAFALTDTEREVSKAGQLWQQAIDSRNPAQIAALYAPTALLYPTFENQKKTPAELLDYFKKITQNDALKVTFDQQNIQVFGNVAINSGLYTFTYKQDGKEVRVPARYTFVYFHKDNQWMIVNHHSSTLPQS